MEPFNIITFFKQRPLSYSSISSFEWSREEWYDNYILGIKKPPSEELIFGSYVDKRLQEDSTYLPHVPRYPIMQHKMGVVFSDIHCIGFADGLDLSVPILVDYKTGKKAWDKKRADETEQLTFYAMMLYSINKIAPEDLKLAIHWLPTQKNNDFSISLIDESEKGLKTFYTKRSMVDVLKFLKKVREVTKKMEEYVIHRQSLTISK